jgi:Domain of unknown function (DUF4412)
MKKGTLMVCVVLSIIFLIAQLSIAGIVIDQRVKDNEGKTTQVILYCSENQLRTDHPESGLSTIMDLKADQIVLIDHRSKGYLSMKLSQWEKEIAKRLKDENPGVRPKERTITVRRSGETATINGFKTEKVQILADTELMEEHWMTRDIQTSEAEKVIEKAALELAKDFRSELKEGQEIQRKLKPYGFSILVKDYTLTSGLKGIDVLEVKKIEKKELKPDVFQPPAGYERIIPQPAKK